MKNVRVPEQVIVVDLEATCWLTQPRSTDRDIIEVGACVLNTQSGSITRTADILVRPTRSRIGLYCQAITGITPERARGGVAFSQACEWLQTSYGASMPWAAWGSWDRAQLETQCAREQVPYPLSSEHIDIKLFVADSFGWKRPESLRMALILMGMRFQGRKHHAVADAVNEARVLYRALLRKQRT